MTFSSDFPAGFDQGRVGLVRKTFDTLRTDYGDAFMGQFRRKAEQFDWKCRLLEMTAKYGDGTYLKAVENICSCSPTRPPNIRQLESEMHRLDSMARQAAKNAALRAEMGREPQRDGGLEKIAQMRSQGFLTAFKGKQADTTPEEHLQRVLAHEAAIWQHCQDKSFPLTRRIASTLAGLRQDGKPPFEIAADAALAVGGEALAIFRHVAEGYAGRA